MPHKWGIIRDCIIVNQILKIILKQQTILTLSLMDSSESIKQQSEYNLISMTQTLLRSSISSMYNDTFYSLTATVSQLWVSLLALNLFTG